MKGKVRTLGEKWTLVKRLLFEHCTLKHNYKYLGNIVIHGNPIKINFKNICQNH